MKRIIISVLIIIAAMPAFSQSDDPAKYAWYKYAYGYQFQRGKFDSVLHVGANPAYSSAKFQLTYPKDQQIISLGPVGYTHNDAFWGQGVAIDSNVTANNLKAVGFGWSRITEMGANGVSLSFVYGGGSGWTVRLKDSLRFSNQNNDAISAFNTGTQFEKKAGQTARSVVLSGGIPFDHSSGVISNLSTIGGSGTNNFKLRGNYAGFTAYPISDNPNHTDSIDNYTGFFAGGGAVPLGQKINIYRGFLSTPGGGAGTNINYYYGAYLSGEATRTSRFYNSGSARFGGSQATTISGPGDDTARFGARLDVDGPIVMQDGNECAGCIMMSDANGKGRWQDTTGLFPGTGGGAGAGWGTTGEVAELTGDASLNNAGNSFEFTGGGPVKIDGNSSNGLKFYSSDGSQGVGSITRGDDARLQISSSLIGVSLFSGTGQDILFNAADGPVMLNATTRFGVNAPGTRIANDNATTNAAASAILDVVSTTKGVLPPRLTTTQRNAISSPATGLTLFCTDCTATDASTGVMQTYNGSTWKNYW